MTAKAYNIQSKKFGKFAVFISLFIVVIFVIPASSLISSPGGFDGGVSDVISVPYLGGLPMFENTGPVYDTSFTRGVDLIIDEYDNQDLIASLTSLEVSSSELKLEYSAEYSHEGNMTSVNLVDGASVEQVESFSYNADGIAPGHDLGDSDLSGYWPMDTGSGPTAYDSTSNQNNGMIHGATWTISGQFDDALSFDGGNDDV